MVEISIYFSEGSSCYPGRTRHPVVHRYNEIGCGAYGSDSPGCIRQFHCSILHQQAGRNTVNTTAQTDLEATSQVSDQPNSASGTTHPAIMNVLADILSRPSGTEWSIHPSVFRALTLEWGIPLVDLFTIIWNHKLPLIVSPVPDPSAMAVDTLSMSWKTLWAYAYHHQLCYHGCSRKHNGTSAN